MADWRDCVTEEGMMQSIVDKTIIPKVEQFVIACMKKGLHTIEDIYDKWKGQPLTFVQFASYTDLMLYKRMIACVSGAAWWYVNEPDKLNQLEIEW